MLIVLSPGRNLILLHAGGKGLEEEEYFLEQGFWVLMAGNCNSGREWGSKEVLTVSIPWYQRAFELLEDAFGANWVPGWPLLCGLFFSVTEPLFSLLVQNSGTIAEGVTTLRTAIIVKRLHDTWFGVGNQEVIFLLPCCWGYKQPPCIGYAD